MQCNVEELFAIYVGILLTIPHISFGVFFIRDRKSFLIGVKSIYYFVFVLLFGFRSFIYQVIEIFLTDSPNCSRFYTLKRK